MDLGDFGVLFAQDVLIDEVVAEEVDEGFPPKPRNLRLLAQLAAEVGRAFRSD